MQDYSTKPLVPALLFGALARWGERELQPLAGPAAGVAAIPTTPAPIMIAVRFRSLPMIGPRPKGRSLILADCGTFNMFSC